MPRLSGVFEPVGGFGQTLDTQAAWAALAFASAGDKPGIFEDFQMLRYGRQTHGEGLGDFLNRHVAVGRQPVQNRNPGRITERGKGLNKLLRNKLIPLPNEFKYYLNIGISAVRQEKGSRRETSMALIPGEVGSPLQGGDPFEKPTL